jgi:putative ABC transport system permease protein
MLKNYLVLFLRNLRRQKLFSVINLLGLTVSMASTLLIYLYVHHEFSFDSFHPDVDRIYRINQTFIWGENSNAQFSSTGPGVAYALKAEIAEAELITSIHTPGNFIVSYTKPSGEVISFEENKVLAADTNFFRMFDFGVLTGDPAVSFREANSLVMTKSTAKKYFGDEEPIGKLVQLGAPGEQKTYEVTAITEDTPDNSYIEYDVLLSLRGYPIERLSWSWVWTQLETYIRLQPNADVALVKQKIAAIPQKHVGPTLKAAMNTTYEEYIKSGKKWELFMQPMTSIHLPDGPVLNRLNDTGNMTIIYSFIGAAIFIVLLSCVNFMNLSTAQFTRRIKEASVRKILGLGKKQLSLGYFFEALTFCLMALMLAVALTQLLLPGFNLITEKTLQLDWLNNPEIFGFFAALAFFMAAISASYPALFLSAFNPVEAIKGKLKVGRQGKSFRNSLVVFQFSVSIVLIICTAIVFQQLKFVSDKDIGFNKENLMVLNHVEAVKDGEVFAHEAMKISGVEQATWCTSVPPRLWGGDTFSAEGNSEMRFPMNFTTADQHYLPTLDIKLKLGRNFSDESPGDFERVIVNEATIKKIGWPMDESVLGKKILYPGGDNLTFEIIGVVADFNYWSLANPIEPMGIFHVKSQGSDKGLGSGKSQYLTLRMEAQNQDAWEASIVQLRQLWKVHAGDTPFDYEFVEQAFAETFKSQQQFGTVLTVMATLAILIASLGLLGMIIYALEQRTKEIGIRKVSGASVWDILKLISQGYTKLIAIAFLLGAPFSYWLMQQWLKDFAYRITPSVWIFIVTGVSTLVVAILITSYHSLKAALTNPVEVLKDE